MILSLILSHLFKKKPKLIHFFLASDAQRQSPAITATVLFPRHHIPLPSETIKSLPSTTATAAKEETQTEDQTSKEVPSEDQPPSREEVSSEEDKPSEKETSSEEKSSEDDENDEEEDSHHSLNPNVTAGIVVGVAFGVLLIIAAFMYAFRVGWEKGQESANEKNTAQPPAPTLEPWHQMDVIRPPDVVLGTGSSCWDSESWSCCGDHIGGYRTIGERYSFRPGRGVYEIRDSNPEEVGQGEPEVWPADGSHRTDSGVGLGHEEGKGKGREML